MTSSDRKKGFVKLALQELDKLCSENLNKSFQDGLLKHERLEYRKGQHPLSESERSVLFYVSQHNRQFADTAAKTVLTRQFADTAAKTVLTEDESAATNVKGYR